MKLNKITFSFLILATSLFSSCISNEANSLLTDAEMILYRTCSIDSDCVYANNGCCDCATGGQDVAINKTKLAEFEALFNCADVACTMIGASPACGSGTVSCNIGLCEYNE